MDEKEAEARPVMGTIFLVPVIVVMGMVSYITHYINEQKR